MERFRDEPTRILYVGADQPSVSEHTGALERTRDDFSVDSCPSRTACLDSLESGEYDCVVSDPSFGEAEGLALLRAVREGFPDLPFILLTASDDATLASEAISAGVTDFYPDVEGVPTDLPARIAAAVEDYHDRRRLREERELYEHIVDMNTISTVVVNRDREVVLADRRASDRLGFESVEDQYTVGTRDVYDTDGEFVPPEDRPYVRVFETGEPIEDWVCQIDLPEAGRRWISITARPLTEDGTVTHVVISADDITERRERTRKLRDEKERFQRLVQEVQDYAIFRLDTEGYVTSWNEGAENIKGYEADEIIGKHFSTFYTDEAVAENKPERNLRAAYEQGRIEDEGWRVRKDGSRFWANVIITAIRDGDGNPEGYSKVTRDMTERREYEEQLEYERERLEFVNRLIRHNLLNSLNVVNARAGIIEDHVDAEGRSHLETIQDRTEDMIDLIETLRSLMKVLVEDEERELEPVSLEVVLSEEIAAAQDSHPEADIAVVDELPSVTVLADDLLEEVFQNVLDNAVQHNDTDDPRIRVDVETGADEVTVSIADNGPGVPDDMKETIFEKGTKGFESPGTGFGLHLVQEIVESYDGTIDVADNDPRGAVFRVTIPRA